MSRMKAIYLTRFGTAQRAFEQREVPVPRLSAGQVLIRCEGFGLNFADVMARKGVYQDAPKLPFVPGYDVCGTIAHIGEGATGYSVGDRVAAMTRFGAYAEYAATDARACIKINADIPLTTALALTVQYSTAYYCAAVMTRLFAGDTVLVQAAAGGVGTALVQYALHMGCTVWGTAGTAKQGHLHSIGVHHPVDYIREDVFARIKEGTGGKGPDVIFDSLGAAHFRRGFKALAPGGRLVGFGAADMSERNIFKQIKGALGFGFFHPAQLLIASKSMIGVNMLRIADEQPQMLQHCMHEVYKLYEKGVFRPVDGGTYPLSELATAHELLEKRMTIGKMAISF